MAYNPNLPSEIVVVTCNTSSIGMNMCNSERPIIVGIEPDPIIW